MNYIIQHLPWIVGFISFAIVAGYAVNSSMRTQRKERLKHIKAQIQEFQQNQCERPAKEYFQLEKDIDKGKYADSELGISKVDLMEILVRNLQEKENNILFKEFGALRRESEEKTGKPTYESTDMVWAQMHREDAGVKERIEHLFSELSATQHGISQLEYDIDRLRIKELSA
ncbi:MAG: hypothetical protein JWO00_480 [Candidatus Parcubacteria bacterium]|nr:hypothetical protein [Candidatus Parcubacteria bacterium]